MATTTSKVTADHFVNWFIQLDDLKSQADSISGGMKIDATIPEKFSSLVKSYEVTLRMFKDLSKQNNSSDTMTRMRVEHFKSKLISVEGSLVTLAVKSSLLGQHLPTNFMTVDDNTQFLHKDDCRDARPGSPTTQPAQNTSSSTPNFVSPQFTQSLGTNPTQSPSSFFPPIPGFPGPSSFSALNSASSPIPLPTTGTTTLQPLSQRQLQPLTPPPPSWSSSVNFTPTISPLATSLGNGLSPAPLSPNSNYATQFNSSNFYSSQLSSNSSTTQQVAPKSIIISPFDKNAPINKEIPECVLGYISYLLRTGHEKEALEKFSKLPDYEKTEVYSALWMLRGKPMPGSPLHHDNFGEVSFFNREERCKSTPMQKACAIEIFKTRSVITGTIIRTLSKMSSLLENDDRVEYKNLFNQLPREIQNAIKGKHWENCGKPLPGNPIAHDNFGEVSFLATEKRCDVPHSKRIETVKAVLDLMRGGSLSATYKALGNTISARIQDWETIDSGKARGEIKNNAKKETLHAMAKQMVPLFLPEEAAAPVGSFDSYKALAAAYVEKYPFLKGYFLLMIPDLRINGEIEMDPNAPKQTQAKPPNFSGMDHNAMGNYRRSLHREYIRETLHTLKAGYYVTEKGQKVSLNLLPAVDSVSTHRKDTWDLPTQITDQTKIFLYSKDCLTVAQDCVERGLNPIVLNAANNETPGGGYKTGAVGQEESLMRRTGLSAALDTSAGTQLTNFYPINKDAPHTGVYVSNVPVFRGEEAQGCPYLEKPFETAFAVMPAFNFNKDFQIKAGIQNPLELVPNGQGQPRLPTTLREQLENKLGTIFDMAEHNRHDAIVLVAWGSGAFHNPPEEICDLMVGILMGNFSGSFKEVHLCIVDDHHTGEPFNPQGNYAAYRDVINRKYYKMITDSPGMSFQAL